MESLFHNHTRSPGAVQTLTVAELTLCIKGVIEAEDLFADIWVRGEISNLIKHSSGHIYFSLKDETALIRCVVWQSAARSIRFGLDDGMGVIARGRVTVYEKQGQYQLVVSEVMPDGAGALYTAYEQLKSRLEGEGLFDDERKKPIPPFPRRVAIITSPTAAALRDMVSIARRRMPSVSIFLLPALMQGAGSEASVIESLQLAETIPGIDVVVLGRGGGSIEDLWTFNSEVVVRAIYSCCIPVVSAIGHETDYTLSDFVADLRAPTPSAAMELIIPESEELQRRVKSMLDNICASVEACIARKRASHDLLLGSPHFKYPERMLQGRWQSLDMLESELVRGFRSVVSKCEHRLSEISGKLGTLSPLAVLARGYSIVRRVEDSGVIRRVSDIAVGEATETIVSDGRFVSEVKELTEGWD